MPEQQNIEYKLSWHDDYLKWIAGFANANGGTIYIGKDDNGNVTGVGDYKELLDSIPNKVRNLLGIIVDVNLIDEKGLKYIEILTPAYTVPISLRGRYYYRSGSTKQEFTGVSLQQFLLKKIGVSWEQRIIHEATINDIDEMAIKSFLQKALAKQRISGNAEFADPFIFLKNLQLVNENGEFSLAALLLFGKKPKKFAPSAYFKIGRFGKSDSDLRFQDIVEGNILEMADKVLDILDAKYLTRPISYKGLQRIEGLEYPEKALREAIVNAIIHKDYAGTTIFLSVYDDKLMLWNPGKLPESLTIEKIKGKHNSEPRNRLIADVFFMAGYIEAWGRGMNVIMEGCKEYGMPEPIINEEQGGLSVVFLKDIYSEDYLKTLGLNERQIKAVLYVKENGEITNAQYKAINNLGRTASTEDLQMLVSKYILTKLGKAGRGIKYILSNKS